MSIYERWGVQPIINASGTVTRLGGAPMPDEVVRAFQQAADDWVSLDMLQAAASRQLAEVTGSEAGIVTSGAAAALTLGTAAILSGHDLGRMERLPDCRGMPHEMVVAREQRSGYDHAVRAAGAKLVEVGFNEIVSNAGVRRTEAWEYESAFGPETCGVLYVHAPGSRPALEQVVEVAKRHDLPVLVDAAGELPPRDHLRTFISAGADLVAFSGGKAIRGPQGTGILCGRRDLISSAALQMLDMDDHPELWTPPSDLILHELIGRELTGRERMGGLPRHGIGRGLKVSKEEIAALLVALELFVSGAYDEQLPRLRELLESIVAELADCPVVCSIERGNDQQRWPVLEIAITTGSSLADSADDATSVSNATSAFNICRRLRAGQPPVYVGHGRLAEGKLIVDPICLDAQRASQLASRLRHELMLPLA